MKKTKIYIISILSALFLYSCGNSSVKSPTTTPTAKTTDMPTSVVSAEATTLPAYSSPQMVLVESGIFNIGDTFADGDSDEKPVHEVRLTYDFYIGKYEVTQKEYKILMETNPSYFKGDNLPVEQVTWFDSIKYCNALSKKEGLSVAYDESTGNLLDSNGNVTTDITQVKGYRLATEAEWDYAAKGGNKSQGYKYSGSNTIDEVAWYSDNSDNKTYEVGTKKPNELGIYDMSGNVWEWCTDFYDRYVSYSIKNPYIYKESSYRIERGGSWRSLSSYLRVPNRGSSIPSYNSIYLGFRIVKNK